MKFKDIDFQGKSRYQKSVRKKIFNKIDKTASGPKGFPLSVFDLSVLAIERYLDILIEESHFNPKSHVFYDKISNTKLTYDLFGKIATEYIIEHIDDFFVVRRCHIYPPKGRR